MYSDILHLRYRAETKDRPSWQAPAPQVQSLRAVFRRSLQAPVCRKRTTPRSHRAGRFSAIAGTGQLSAHSVPAPPASLLFPPLLLSFKSTASTEESPVSRKARIVTPRNTGIRQSSRFNRYFFTNTPLLLHGTNRKHRCRVIELVFFQINAFSKARINADFSRCVFAQHRHIVRRPVFAADRELSFDPFALF